MYATRIGAAYPLVENPSPNGTWVPIGEGALGAATIKTG